MWQMRFNWRVVMGLTAFWPGNSQAQGLPMRHHSRWISSSNGDSIAWRSLRPLPCGAACARWLSVAYGAGLRASEVVSLKVSDIDVAVSGGRP
jgi:integrase